MIVTFTLNDVQESWSQQFSSSGQTYQPAKLVLFTDSTRSGCGYGAAAMGPFYCPADQNVYIDLGFYHDLKNRFGAPGDFAQAYVLAHEIGHHVQNVLGTEGEVRRLRSSRPDLANELSVRLGLPPPYGAAASADAGAGGISWPSVLGRVPPRRRTAAIRLV